MTTFNYSIIVPFRDKYDLFLVAIRSIPDREDIQIIIVDNAIQPLQQEQIPNKANAKVIYTTSSPLKGAGCARNVGLTKVGGKFILFLDADDYFTQDAFTAFDKYLKDDYDIVYFKSDSIYLTSGKQSRRHITINKLITSYFETGNADVLRYRFVNPIAKMLRTEFVLRSSILFDEIRVSNDVWFSVMTGHLAKRVIADESVVYMITEGESGTSLSCTISKENWFMRYQVMVKVNVFLKSVGKYNYRIRLLGGLYIAWKQFGFNALWEFYTYARNRGIGIF